MGMGVGGGEGEHTMPERKATRRCAPSQIRRGYGWMDASVRQSQLHATDAAERPGWSALGLKQAFGEHNGRAAMSTGSQGPAASVERATRVQLD